MIGLSVVQQGTQVSPNVLIVDDQRNMRLTLKDILEDRGCDVVTAESGDDAVKLCLSSEFDTVLMDLRMRGMDGLEAFQQIHQHDNKARVILMSAYGKEETRRAALDLGALAFLSKPLDLDMLIRLICNPQAATIVILTPDRSAQAEMISAVESKGYLADVVHSVYEARLKTLDTDHLALVIDHRFWGDEAAELQTLKQRRRPESLTVLMNSRHGVADTLSRGRPPVPESVISISCNEVWALLDLLAGESDPDHARQPGNHQPHDRPIR